MIIPVCQGTSWQENSEVKLTKADSFPPMKPLIFNGFRSGGDSWTRTNDPIDVNDVLSGCGWNIKPFWKPPDPLISKGWRLSEGTHFFVEKVRKRYDILGCLLTRSHPVGHNSLPPVDITACLRGHNGLPSFDITGCLLAFQMLCFESTLFQSQHDIIDAFFAHSR